MAASKNADFTATEASPDAGRGLTIERIYADPLARQNPHAMFAATRSATPLYKTDRGMWLVTGHRPTAALLRDPRLSRWEAAKLELYADADDDPEVREMFTNDPGLQTAIDAINLMLIQRDEPDHTRLRRLVRQAFLPAAIEGWRTRVEDVSRTILSRVVVKPEFDFLREVAFPLPEILICEMTGVPHADHALWSAWSHACVGTMRNPKPRGENLRRGLEGYRSFYLYFKELIAKRRRSPGDDLISTLIKAEEEGDHLSEDEIIGTMTMLIQAGHETTANLVANGMLILLDNAGLYRDLRNHPDRIPRAIDEFLRFDGPAGPFSAPRVATEDIAYDDIVIAKGDRVVFVRPAANRDPAVFENPDRVDIDRPNLQQHQAFGLGPHVCLGRQLALLEAEVMFKQVMRELPELELVRRPAYGAMTTRGLTELRVRRKTLSS
jgi:cytochrome P450